MSMQQYRHCGRKLTPDELVEFLTDQHAAMVDDPIMLWLSPQSLEDFADLIHKAIRDGESAESGRIWGVNQLGNWKWCAWTAISLGNRLKHGTFERLSEHETEQQAHEAANEARAEARQS